MQSVASINLNFQQPNFVTVYAVQNDALSRRITASILDGSTAWEPPAGTLMTIRYRKPDGTSGYYDTLENGASAYSFSGANTVDLVLAEQALTVPGQVPVELNFYNADGQKLSTLMFIVAVAPSVCPDDEIVSSDYFNVLTATLAEAAQIWTQIQAAYGAPRTAATAAAMTDHALIYVYTGSQTGYTNGNWYYYNGTAWVSGGAYNSAADIQALRDAVEKVITHEATTTCTHAYAVGDYFVYDYTNTLFRVTSPLAVGDVFASGVSVKPVTDYTSYVNVLAGLNRNTEEKLVKLPYLYPYSAAAVTQGKYLDSTGTVKSASSWNITDFLPLGELNTYSGLTTAPSAAVYDWYYDSSRNLLSSFKHETGDSVLHPPEGAVFVRFCVTSADKNNFVFTVHAGAAIADVDAFPDVIALPDDVYLYNGIQTNIYRDSLFVPDGAENNIQTEIPGSSPKTGHGLNFAECWRLQPSASITADETLTVQRYDKKLSNVLAKKAATLHFGTAAHNAGTVKCLFLGDSTTEQGNYLYPLLNNFSGDNTVVESVGTRPTINYPSVYCEGRSGWSLTYYVTYAKLGSGATEVTNAFWNPSTSAFDFSYYMAQNQSGVTLDYVFILLGINDLVKLGSAKLNEVQAAAATFCTNLETVIDSIKAYDSNIKVVFGLVTTPAKSQDAWATQNPAGFHYRDQFKRNVVLFNAALIDALRDNDDVYLLDTNLCIDAAHNMGTETVQVNSRNTAQIVRQNNMVHYPIEGGAQVADRIFAFLKNV